ncbi:hypothetical protein Dda_2338 [Drechslerella dactyloides]|uniref:Mtf2-like C-terminal domain-containing protein n=1 Tax=Drechslerella dactyloides TaxID=74499 RepID=A0AAD6NMJ8_DREDA|nr:hypothetical protein Dda_2338 [Drechslerella dactyloides]
MLLSFLYPPAARRHIARAGYPRILRKSAPPCPFPARRQYSSIGGPRDRDSHDDLPSTPRSSSSSAAQNDGLGFLVGEGTEEEEMLLRPKKRKQATYVQPTSRTFHPSPRRSHFPGIPKFRDSDGDVRDDASMTLGANPRGHMTEREKVIFDTIFDKLLQKQAAATASTGHQQSPLGPPTPASKVDHARPSPMIAALFESAVGPQRSGDEVSFGPERTRADDKGSMRAVLAKGDFPASLRYAAAGAVGLPREAAGLPSDEHTEERAAEYNLLKNKLGECGSDLEVWEFLDKHVFSMVREPPTPPSADDTTTPATATTPPSSNYPKLLRDAIRVFRNAYRDYDACIALFEHVKRLGPESYIIGCSVALYNEVLLARWIGYRDIQAIGDLLDEMRLNGVEGDTRTAAIVTDVLADINVFEHNYLLPGTVLMWQNENVVEGKGKLKTAITELVREGDRRGSAEYRA